MTSLHDKHRHAQRGAAMMEALIAMLIVAFGVLGFVGLQARTAVVNLEGYQRAQALILLNDMAQRISANRANVGSYVTTSATLYPGGGDFVAPSCTATTAGKDLCEWHTLLQGAAEKEGTTSVGAITKARGCVELLAGTTNSYVVTVFWEGVQASGDSPVRCGWSGGTSPTGVYAANLRRGVSTIVRIGTLS